mmetsp:Transcript_4388/g.8446  ORF Transcript_4388/g.8446 Transcript_4388/m.8446 type:complete len:365 (-) Transcript_4388:235-1329(-)
MGMIENKRTIVPRALVRFPVLVLYIITFLCPPPLLHFTRSSTPTSSSTFYYANGLVNVSPFAISNTLLRGRRGGRVGQGGYRGSRSKTTTTSRKAAAQAMVTPPSQQKLANNPNDDGIKNIKSPPHHHEERVWMPPSQNVKHQRSGNIFTIRHPEDLLDFVIEDDRLSVVKVYASWCKTCQIFDMRYRKLASQYGDKYDTIKKNAAADSSSGNSARNIAKKGRVRFAEMELKDENAEILMSILSKSKQPLSLPYILMYYKGSGSRTTNNNGMVMRDFQCSPKKFRLLVDAVEELTSSDSEEISVVANGEEGLNHRSLPLNGGDLASSSQRSMDGTSSTTTTALMNGVGATQSYLSTLNNVNTAS